MIAVQTPEVETSTTMGWFLKGIIPPEKHVVRIPVPDGRFQVGRRPDTNLCLPVPSVSKLHAELVATEFALFVRDLGSTNGTFVNGARITEDTPIDECDVVQFAKYEFIVGRTRISGGSKTVVSCAEDWVQSLTQFHRLMQERGTKHGATFRRTQAAAAVRGPLR